MTQPDPHFEALILHLKEARGFDFTGYKRSSLLRRVHRRLAEIDLPDLGEYLDYLQVHPDEFTALFNTILINVTSFFRDADAWDNLRDEVLPTVLAGKDQDSPVRVWSAGCASGEEAYSVAMLLAEQLGPDEFRHRVKIYATDVDEESLSDARQASYGEREVASVPAGLLAKYFDPHGNRYTFQPRLRRSIIFGRNDLVQDAPISRVDLLACRNTLMYFNAETQSRIVSRFHFALAPGGVLFLGKAEMLLSHANLFVPLDLKQRIFRKVPLANPAAAPEQAAPPGPPPADHARLDRLQRAAFTASPLARIVLSDDGVVVLANQQAESLLGVTSMDVGRPFRDLDVSYRPVELRGYIEQAQADRRLIRVDDVEYVRATGDTQYLEIQVNPLVEDDDAGPLGVALVFMDVTAAHLLRRELEYANRQLETAYEELQSTNEELETTNEELQSTNEELETMNEELQSTNDELKSLNNDLRDRTAELDNANVFLEAILTSLRAGVAVVNRDMRVGVWNRRAEDLWGLRPDEALGQHFLDLDIGLPTDELRPIIRRVLSGESEAQELRLTAINRRGRTIEVRVVATPLGRGTDGITGAILLMDSNNSTPEPPQPLRESSP